MSTLYAFSTVYYSCDFETQAQRSSWVLNSTNNASLRFPNRWWMGDQGNFDPNGFWGLYISTDSIEPSYSTATGSTIFCYDTLTLQPGNYMLQFDWRALGSTNTVLHVFWVPRTQVTNSVPTMGTISTALTQYQIGTVKNSKNWKPARISFNTTGNSFTQGKLVFAWVCGKDNSDPRPPAACVDNLLITDVCTCPAPNNLKYRKDSAKLSWNPVASAQYYQVRDYSSFDGTVINYDSVFTNSMRFNLTSEGTHIFYVRSVCGEDCYSDWASTSGFAYISGNRCIEYLDYGTGANAGVCYEGDFATFITQNRQGSRSMQDNGPASQSSTHTMHTDPNEIDPSTVGSTDGSAGLNTVPDGEIASIRLGAYTGAGSSSRIEYKYTVPQGVSDLMDLKYAIVLKSGGHEENIQPSFKLEVLDGRGQQLPSSCTYANFIPGFGDTQSWHEVPDPSWPNESTWWSDWQSMTISLRPYVNQTLTIRLTATRCTYDTHFAKGYFTLSCRDGGLEGLACGDFSTDHFTAPDGFTYRWYKEDDPNKVTLGTDRRFDIDPMDDQIYMVECHSLLDPFCYYVLTANPNPRMPVAKGSYSVKSENCSNIVSFDNESFIRVVSRADGSTMEEGDRLRDVLIDFGDGTVKDISALRFEHEYPNTGGTFQVTMTAYINSGDTAVCTNDTVFTIQLPDLVHTGDTAVANLQIGTPYVGPYTGRVYNYMVDTLVVDSIMLPNKYGCDAPFYEYVYYHAIVSDTLHAILCHGDSILFEVGDTLHGYAKRYFYESTFDSAVYHLPLGYDSISFLDLYVVPRLEIDMTPEVVACNDIGQMEIPFSIRQGDRQYGGVELFMNDAARAIGLDSVYQFGPDDELLVPVDIENVIPGYGALTACVVVMQDTVGAPICSTDTLHVQFTIEYASIVMDQKHDFIGLLNENYNYGGFVYYRYRWYRDDMLLLGDTLSYIHVTTDDIGHEYRAELTRVDDNVTVKTCAMTYVGGTEDIDFIFDDRTVRAVYDVLGRPLSTDALRSRGMYIVVFTDGKGAKYVVQ